MTQRRYESELFAQLEAILLISDEPVTIQQLVKVTEASPPNSRPPSYSSATMTEKLTVLFGFSTATRRRRLASLYRADHADVVAHMVQGATQKLNQLP